MKTSKRKALEAAGWKFGDAADFLGMKDETPQTVRKSTKLVETVRSKKQGKLNQQKSKTKNPRR